MRRLIGPACLLSLGLCAPAFAQDNPESASPSVVAAHVVASSATQVELAAPAVQDEPRMSTLGWVGVGTAATGLALFGWSMVEMQMMEVGSSPTSGMLLRRATGAVATAVGSGLVLIDLVGEHTRSQLYVRFGSDAMPSLRWKTRF